MHNCTKEEPRCVDRRTLVEKPERQEIISRVLGHHCYEDTDIGNPNPDRRVLYSRIGVVFSHVTHRSGYLETITIYFEGEEPQIMGSVDAIGKKNDFHAYDPEQRGPGSKLTLEVGKRVEFLAPEGRCGPAPHRTPLGGLPAGGLRPGR